MDLVVVGVELGPFVVGATITGSTSGAEAEVLHVAEDGGATTLTVDVGGFHVGELVAAASGARGHVGQLVEAGAEDPIGAALAEDPGIAGFTTPNGLSVQKRTPEELRDLDNLQREREARGRRIYRTRARFSS